MAEINPDYNQRDDIELGCYLLFKHQPATWKRETDSRDFGEAKNKIKSNLYAENQTKLSNGKQTKACLQCVRCIRKPFFFSRTIIIYLVIDYEYI